MLNQLARFFDYLHLFWEQASIERGFGMILLWIYLLALAGVELHQLGYYPHWLPSPPSSHFFAIQLAFTLILGLEVISLIFILPASVSRGIGKQLEILTLILLRNAFKELSILPQPINVDMSHIMQVVDIAASGLGAVCVFLCLGLYRKIVRRKYFLHKGVRLDHYVRSKKLLSLALLVIFGWLGLWDMWLFFHGAPTNFFETIYTVLIFADIAMVLIAQRYMPCYYAVFRNSGFVIGTLMMRLSLSAPPLLCSGIAIFSGLYILVLTWGTNMFMPDYPAEPEDNV